MIKVIADRFIPFLQGRLEPYCDISYLHPDEITPSAVACADALLIRTRTRCGAPLLEGSRVSFIASGTIGMDQFDLPWCASRGIATHNSPGCNAPAVAQYVWSCLLHLRLDPRTLTIGIVGHGNVGSIVAEWGRHLGARVLLCDPPRQRAGGEGYIPLDELLAQSDVVTLHCPLTREGEDATFHMIGERETSLMRQGAILINAARGAVIDTSGVVRAARRGSIRLITDCWEGEPDALNPEQLALSLIATPHIAGYSLQGKQRATRMVLENLARHFSLPLATEPEQEGIKVWDLPEPYRPVESITPYEIMKSYDPMADDALLRRNPSCFEWERDRYDYRSEPQYTRPRAPRSYPGLELARCLEQGRVPEFMARLAELLPRYPYDMRLDSEQDFQRLLFATLLTSGLDIEAEHHTHLGRIDLLVTTPALLYIIELKNEKTAFEALDQIEERAYARGLRTGGRRIIKLGISYSPSRREITHWAMESDD